MTPAERRDAVVQSGALRDETKQAFEHPQAFDITRAEAMIENAIGVYGLPIGIATNFRVNGRDVLVPMAIEEPSVVAGASWAAKASRILGGFMTTSTERRMIGQIHLCDVPDPEAAIVRLQSEKEAILVEAIEYCPRMVSRGGGPRDLEVRALGERMLAVHVIIDTLDAMGANSVNGVVEGLAPRVAAIAGGHVVMRILSNYTDQCMATARVEIPAEALAKQSNATGPGVRTAGEEVLEGIVLAQRVAELDPYRAVTHNKGVMNGVDAVIMATGNDWRAIEAAAHAHAARNGKYGPLTQWSKSERATLVGKLELPMPVGTVGGTIPLHPVARASLEILGVQSARELAEITVAVGLAQNLAALRSLVSVGIQSSHMGLHARSVAASAGARGGDIDRIAEMLMSMGDIRVERAQALLGATAEDHP